MKTKQPTKLITRNNEQSSLPSQKKIRMGIMTAKKRANFQKRGRQIMKGLKQVPVVKYLRKKMAKQAEKRRKEELRRIAKQRQEDARKSDGVGHWDHHGKTHVNRTARFTAFEEKQSEKEQDKGRER